MARAPQPDPHRVPDPIQEALAKAQGELALFDADGTLWHGDVSEDFVHYMIEQGHFDPTLWPVYDALNQKDAAAACFKILEFYTGFAPDMVAECSAIFWQEGVHRNWHVPAVSLLELAHKRGLQCVVVTATPQPVMPGLRKLLPVDDIIALNLEVDASGRYTGRHKDVPSVGADKATRVGQAHPGKPVALAAGNSILDLEMLKLADLAVGVSPDGPLAQELMQRRWPVLMD